jgi:hypothetical protein
MIRASGATLTSEILPGALQRLVLGPMIFNASINDLGDAINYVRYLHLLMISKSAMSLNFLDITICYILILILCKVLALLTM